MSEQKEYGLIVDMDSLYDTRAASFMKVGEDVYKKAIQGGYPDTNLEYFPKLGDANAEAYRIYKGRDISLLSEAPITGVYNLLNMILLSVYLANMKVPGGAIPTIFINIYPYTSDSDVIVHNIATIARNLYFKDIDIKAIRANPIDLVGDFMKDHVVKYWINSDINTIGPELVSRDMVGRNLFDDLKMMCPKAIRQPDKLASRVINVNGLENPFNSLPLLFSTDFNLEFVNPGVFRSELYDVYRDDNDGVLTQVEELIKKLESEKTQLS